MTIILTAEPRQISGAKVSKLRAQNLIPAVVYGPEVKPVNIQVNARLFAKVFKDAGETQLIDLMVGKDKIPALIHDFQRDPVNNGVTHVDFLQVAMNRAIHAKVPIKFGGVSLAVKNHGAVIVTNLREIDVKALPNKIPAFIAVDLGVLKNYHDEVVVGDLKLPAEVTLITDQKLLIISALPPRTQTELEALNEKVEEKVAEVEAVKQKTPEEKAAEAAAGAGAKPEGDKAEAAAKPAAKPEVKPKAKA